MTQTPEEIASGIVLGHPCEGHSIDRDQMIADIATAIRDAEDRGRKASSVDANECGLWCPNCGAHLRAPEGEAKP